MSHNPQLPAVISDDGRREYSPEVRRAIVSALRIGCTRRASYQSAGISEATFYRWLEDEPGFRDEVEKAEGEAERLYTSRLTRLAAAGDPSSVRFWLERRRPADWRERKTIEATGADGGPLVFRDMSDDELTAEIERLKSIAADGEAMA